MSKAFKLSGKVEKKSRFDIFGFFSKISTVAPEDQAALAAKTANEWAAANGYSSATVTSYSMVGGKFEVKVKVN